MEIIDLFQLFKYYLKKIQIIILTTILAILIGYFYVEYIQVPMYHGTTTIILVQKSENDDNFDVTQNELTVNEKLVSTYSEIIKSRRVLEQVIEKLELKTSTKELAEQIKIESISETSIIKIIVSDKNNKKAVKIANEVAEVFKEEISNLYNLENVSTVDKAIVEKKPYNVNKVKHIIIFTLSGIILSSSLIFLMYYFDNTIKTSKEIEEKLQLPVLGEVPVTKKLTKKKKKRILTNKNHEIKDNKIYINNDKIIESPKKKSTKTTSKKSSTKKTSTPKSDTKKSTVKSNTSKSSTKKSTTKNTTKKKSTNTTKKSPSKKVEGGSKDERTNSK